MFMFGVDTAVLVANKVVEAKLAEKAKQAQQKEWDRVYRKKVEGGMPKRMARRFASVHMRIKRACDKLNADERYWR